MKLFKISTIALAMALTGWVACGSSSNTTDVPNIPSGTGGTVPVDTASGSGGAGGSTGVPDSGVALDTGRDAAIPGQDAPDAPIVLDGGGSVDAPPPVDDGPPVSNICTGLTPSECHLAIINAPADPSVSALDPGPNPPDPYPNCAAQ